MSYSIQYLPTVRQDVADIKAYMTQFYESTFTSFMTRFERSVDNLVELPYIGVAYKDYRRLVVGDYLVFYQVNETKRIVQIHRILHGAQDLPTPQTTP